MSRKRKRSGDHVKNDFEKTKKRRKLDHPRSARTKRATYDEEDDVDTIDLNNDLDFFIYKHLQDNSNQWFSPKELETIIKKKGEDGEISLTDELGEGDVDVLLKKKVQSFARKMVQYSHFLKTKKPGIGMVYKHCSDENELQAHNAKDDEDYAFVPGESSEDNDEIIVIGEDDDDDDELEVTPPKDEDKEEEEKEEEKRKKRKRKKKRKKKKRKRRKKRRKTKKKRKARIVITRKRKDEDEDDDNDESENRLFTANGDHLPALIASCSDQQEKEKLLKNYLLKTFRLIQSFKEQIGKKEIIPKSVIFNVSENDKTDVKNISIDLSQIQVRNDHYNLMLFVTQTLGKLGGLAFQKPQVDYLIRLGFTNPLPFDTIINYIESIK